MTSRRHKVKPLTTRSEIFETDLYRMDRAGRFGERREYDVKRLKELHAKTLEAQESLPDFPVTVSPDDLRLEDFWVCDVNINPAIHCVFNISKDPAMDNCVYCGQPHERK